MMAIPFVLIFGGFVYMTDWIYALLFAGGIAFLVGWVYLGCWLSEE